MITSDSLAAFTPAFVKAQSEMEGAKKDKTNPAFKSKYADLAAVQEACFPALNANGIAVLQAVEATGDQITVTTRLQHVSGEWMQSTLSMKPTKADPQGAGSAATYARRYGLSGMAGVALEDDDGNAASAKPKAQLVTNPGTELNTSQALLEAIGKAKNLGELAALKPQIMALGEEASLALSPAFGARATALKGK